MSDTVAAVNRCLREQHHLLPARETSMHLILTFTVRSGSLRCVNVCFVGCSVLDFISKDNKSRGAEFQPLR